MKTAQLKPGDEVRFRKDMLDTVEFCFDLTRGPYKVAALRPAEYPKNGPIDVLLEDVNLWFNVWWFK